MSGARMANPCMAVDDALPALLKLGETIKAIGVDGTLLELTHLRCSQINECSVCVDLAFKSLTKLGVTPEKMVAVSAWRQSTLFDLQERAVLAVAEELTRLADCSPGVSDETFEELASLFDEKQVGAILLNIALVNLWNRINDATHQVPGSW